MVIDTGGIAKLFKNEVEKDTAEFFKKAVTTKARTAQRRPSFVRGANGKKYSYAKWQNTGQLANNIKIVSSGKGKTVTDGTRGNYSDGSYHGMYFLVEKRGEQDIKNVMKQGEKFVTGLKLNI